MRKKLVTKNINVGVVVLVFIISCCVLNDFFFLYVSFCNKLNEVK